MFFLASMLLKMKMILMAFGMQRLLFPCKAVQELSAEVQEQRRTNTTTACTLDSKNEKVADVNSKAILFQNTPNPFDSETEIKMTLPDNVGHGHRHDLQSRRKADEEHSCCKSW